MKITILLIFTLFTEIGYSLDCERVFSFSQSLECKLFSKRDKKKEKKVVKSLLRRKIDTSELRSNYKFIEAKSICSDELRSIQDYSNFNYRVYNRALRESTEDSISEDFQKDICLISKGISKIDYFPGPVFRGMGLTSAIAQKYLKIGNVITERSFLSTDKNLGVAVGFSRTNDTKRVSIVLKFIDPIGHGIRDLSLNPLEDEVLIDRNKQFFVKEVEEVHIPGHSYYLVTLENY
jgi:hypothetical protein